MTIPLVLEGAFASEQALRDLIVTRKVCFDHDPFYVKDGSDRVVQIGFQLNLYAAFQDPAHLPTGDDSELRELVGDLHRLCPRVLSIVGSSETLPISRASDASDYVFSGTPVSCGSLPSCPYF